MASDNIKIFFVEDDLNLGLVTMDYLESQGFTLIHYADGKEAFEAVDSIDFDLAVLDIMLPGVDGYEIAKKIHKTKHEIPVIFLTAKSMPTDRLEGLKLGAEDYITKPFLTEELKLRIETVLKRSNIEKKARLKNKMYYRIGRYRFYPESGILKSSDKETDLTTKESALLSLLFENRNTLVTRDKAFSEIWRSGEMPGSRTLDVYIGKLRKILSEDPGIHIRNIHGKGYKLEIKP